MPFANSLQRIGKHTAFATGECIGRPMARPMHSPVHFNAKANGKWQMHRRRLGFADFNAKAKWQMMIGQRERREKRDNLVEAALKLR
jgi:hypothetical protein